MSTLRVPESGLSLCRDNLANDSPVKPTQIMRLNLAQSTLDDLIQSLRSDQPARLRLGKHPTLYYAANKSQPFHSCPETHRSEIYARRSGDQENLYFTGLLSHSLEVQKAKEDTAATDQALANLELSLNAFERGKESKKTHIITDIDQVRALRAGDSRSSTGRQAALLAGKPSSKVEWEKDRLLKNAANRSLSSSPALGVTRSPTALAPLTPTSAPLAQNKDRVRLEALKVPLIHLLAVRAVSTKFLAKQTRASIEDCDALARKYGIENKFNPEKFDLKDRAFRDLDVWNFPYPSQEDRQEAIENAISAFDRQRISRSDKLWQMLLPKEERGKGKCLSRLDLRTGPVKKPLTPRIQVEDAGKEGDTTGPETDKASGNGRLTPTPRSAPTTQKKPADKKAPAKSTTAKKNPTNSTLTGRVLKNRDRKATSKPDGKFKSAEFVHDSDEDDTDMADASASEQPAPEKPKPQPKAPVKQTKPTVTREPFHVPTPRVDPPERAPPKAESPSKTAAKSPATKRLPSSRPPAQKSPQKPSPLGSSPPTNASDIQSRSRSSSQNNSASSSSSSPLITQLSRPKKPITDTTDPAKPRTNGVIRPPSAVNPLKRKAELDRPSTTPAQGRTTGDLEHKRRRAVSTSSGSTTGSASPPLSREILLQQLREKSRRFKQRYAKYRALHDAMASHPDPPRAEMDRLEKFHAQLQLMKKEIWDEDRRLRHDL
jgi:RNA polymerase II elongation factor ELL